MSRVAVWKVGGSLFDLPDLVGRLGRRLSNQQGERVLLVPGGGPAADLVRDWQHRTGLNDETAHWLALRALDFNAHLLAAMLPNGCVATTRDEAISAWRRGEQPVLAPTPFVQDVERQSPHAALPHSWNVTSDSLAAWIAQHWPADELMLLKSRPLPANLDLTGAARQGLVDAHFPVAARNLERLGWCDLRGGTSLNWQQPERQR
jgi:aspartokinase-like uncharacterized kinase